MWTEMDVAQPTDQVSMASRPVPHLLYSIQVASSGGAEFAVVIRMFV